MARGRTLLLGATLALAAFGSVRALAADTGAIVAGAEVPTSGVSCQDPVVQVFPSVWLGHFTGGYSHYLGEGSAIVLDWRDEQLCFPDNQSCTHYIKAMRRDFRRPEGYFTCLPIR